MAVTQNPEEPLEREEGLALRWETSGSGPGGFAPLALLRILLFSFV